MPKANFNRSGSALFIVLSIILIVIIFGCVIMSIISSQSRLTHHQISRIQAYYAALGGMNLAFEQLRTGIWGPGSYTLCSSGCTVNDSTIPFQVTINIGAPGSGINGTSRVGITTTYTYTP